jgi:hypothetical protein
MAQMMPQKSHAVCGFFATDFQIFLASGARDSKTNR